MSILGTNPTLKDVAKAAGVSTSTVSRLFNNGSVSEKNREKIQEAIKKLNYHPNAIARSLRGASTFTVGFIIPDITNPFFTNVIKEIGKMLKDKGYSILVYSTFEDYVAEQQCIEDFMQRRVDGLLVTSTSQKCASTYEKINKIIPVIQIDRIISPNLDSIRTDNYGGAMQAVCHLVNRGHKKIATIAGPQNYTPGRERYEGYLKALELYNIPMDEKLIEFGDFSVESGYLKTKTILDQAEKLDAIFVANNFMGVGAIKALKEVNKRIPEDIAVIMMDDIELADIADPPITVVAQSLEEIGRKAGSLFIERIENKVTLGIKEIIIQPNLIIRKSI